MPPAPAFAPLLAAVLAGIDGRSRPVGAAAGAGSRGDEPVPREQRARPQPPPRRQDRLGACSSTKPSGDIRRDWLGALADDIAALKEGGRDVLVVSSGAIAAGRRHLRLAPGHLRLDEKQAAAATGMIRLAHAYQEALARFDITVAQVLLTLDDSEDRRRYINARTTL